MLDLYRAHNKQLAGEASLAYAFAAYFLFGLLYGLFSLVGYFYGHLPSGILLNFIPAKSYYLWEGIFMIPVTMQIYILFAALAHQLSKLLSGRGTGIFNFWREQLLNGNFLGGVISEEWPFSSDTDYYLV